MGTAGCVPSRAGRLSLRAVVRTVPRRAAGLRLGPCFFWTSAFLTAPWLGSWALLPPRHSESCVIPTRPNTPASVSQQAPEWSPICLKGFRGGPHSVLSLCPRRIARADTVMLRGPLSSAPRLLRASGCRQAPRRCPGLRAAGSSSALSGPQLPPLSSESILSSAAVVRIRDL